MLEIIQKANFSFEKSFLVGYRIIIGSDQKVLDLTQIYSEPAEGQGPNQNREVLDYV